MLTIFALPKPFRGHSGTIQRNALATWTRLRPECQVILFGDEEGIREAAEEAGCEWHPQIKRNDFGTPLLDDAFRQAARLARFDFLCYVNADIMLTDDLPWAVRQIPFEAFLATGRRCNLDHPDPLDLGPADWRSRLRRRAAETGTIDSNRALDYFLFRRRSPVGELPEFAVGRPGWDNWMIFNARRRDIPVVDLSRSVLVLHQLHDYNHVPQRRGPLWQGPEADRNREAAGGPHTFRFCLYEATHNLLHTGETVENPRSLGNRIRQTTALQPGLKWPLEILAFPILQWDRIQRRRRKREDLLQRSVPPELVCRDDRDMPIAGD